MSAHQPGPGLHKRKLAAELAALRGAAGMTTATAAAALDRSRSLISHYEMGTRVPSYPDLRVLLEVYGAGNRLDELNELRERANQHGWWDVPGLSPETKTYLGLESDAVRIRSFAHELVPGMVQHHRYIQAIQAIHRASGTDLDEAVNVRVKRQDRIGRNLTVQVVVTEGLLWRTLHMGAAGADQIRYLRDLASRDGVDVAVLACRVGAYRSMGGGFTLLDFPGGLGPVAYLPSVLGARITDERSAVAELDERYSEVLDLAHSVSDSTVMAAVLERVEGS